MQERPAVTLAHDVCQIVTGFLSHKDRLNCSLVNHAWRDACVRGFRCWDSWKRLTYVLRVRCHCCSAVSSLSILPVKPWTRSHDLFYNTSSTSPWTSLSAPHSVTLYCLRHFHLRARALRYRRTWIQSRQTILCQHGRPPTGRCLHERTTSAPMS